MKTKIVCMGDSITEGFGVEERESYPYRLGVMLGEDYEVVNKGVCCSTAMNLKLDGQVMGFPYVRQERYREALAEKGDIYVILLGTNDAQDGMDDVEDVVNPLSNMISRKGEFVSSTACGRARRMPPFISGFQHPCKSVSGAGIKNVIFRSLCRFLKKFLRQIRISKRLMCMLLFQGLTKKRCQLCISLTGCIPIRRGCS